VRPPSQAPQLMTSPPSLRRRLQTTAFLAVLAGYGVLLGLSQGLQVLQRRVSHAQLVSELRQQLFINSFDWPINSLQTLPSGHQVRLVGRSRLHGPKILMEAGQTWLVSTVPAVAPRGGSVGLEVRENITATSQREYTSQLLLVAVAGVSSLVTSVLLQPVLRAGLGQPLTVLSEALADANPTPNTAVRRIPPNAQPWELRPIAAAFNQLQLRLSASWQQQRTFIDGVAHELRTPITLISGYAQRLERELPGQAPETLRQLSRAINSEADRMTRLVRDLLDLARRDTDRLDLQLAVVDAGDLLLASYERLEPLAAGRLRLHAPHEDADLRVRVDPDRIDQCITNLVQNALKYSPAPKPVDLAVAQNDGQVAIHVRDHGPGVPIAERDRIFDLFIRGAAAPEAGSGSGLGLAMVRLLMERMDGSVQLADPPDSAGGADFQLLLPLASASAPPSPAPADPEALSMKPTPRTV
jgi:two-component system, OmpR family, sensor kinase